MVSYKTLFGVLYTVAAHVD